MSVWGKQLTVFVVDDEIRAFRWKFEFWEICVCQRELPLLASPAGICGERDGWELLHMWWIESPLEDLHNSGTSIFQISNKWCSKSLLGQRAIHVHDALAEEVWGSTWQRTFTYLLASFGVTPKKSSYLKGLSVTPPSSSCMSVGDGCFFLYFNQTNILHTGADVRSQLCLWNQTWEVCKNVKQGHSSHWICFCLGKYFYLLWVLLWNK